MAKRKIFYSVAIILLIAIFILLGNFTNLAFADEDEGQTEPIDALSGFDASIAFNPNGNNWMIADGGDNQIQTRVIGNDNVPVTGVNRVDVTSRQIMGPGGGGIKVAYSPDINKFLVVWANSTTQTGVYGRFVNPDNTNYGDVFDVDTTGHLIVWSSFSNADQMVYDSRNKRFVVATAFYNEGIVLWAISITGQVTRKNVVSAADVAAAGEAGIGLGQTVYNPDNNEYCVNTFYGHDAPASQNWGRDQAVIPVNAANLQVGTPSRRDPPKGDGGWIAYDTADKVYVTVFLDYIDSTVHMQILGSKCSFDNPEEDFSMGIPYARIFVYNLASDTFAVTYEASDASNPNPVVIFKSTGEQVGTYSPFTWASGMNGLYSPTIGPNTTNGTYAAATSRNYGMMEFMAGVGSGDVSTAANYSNFASQSAPTAPTGYPPFGTLIAGLLTWSIRILGISVFVMIFYGGVLWFFSRGNSGEIEKAKSKIRNAVLGAILLLSSYLILRTINPDLVSGTFTLPGVGTTQNH